MDLTHLTHKQIGQIVAVLAHIGISQNTIAFLLCMNAVTLWVRLNEAGYPGFSHIPGWQRRRARYIDEVMPRVEHYLKRLNEGVSEDPLTQEQKEIVTSCLITWKKYQETAHPYQGYRPECHRKDVVQRLYRLGIRQIDIPRITGYQFEIVRFDINDYRPEERDLDRTYPNVFFDYAQSIPKTASGVVIEKGIRDARWYCDVLESYLKKDRIFAYALGTWETAGALEIPSFTPEQEPYVRLHMAIIGKPKLLKTHGSRKRATQEIQHQWELYVRGVESGTFPLPKDAWEVVSHLTKELTADLRQQVWPAWQQSWCEILDQMIDELPENKRHVIREYYGFNGTSVRSAELAKKKGVSGTYIRLIIAETIKKLRKKYLSKIMVAESVPFGLVNEAWRELRRELEEARIMIEEMRNQSTLFITEHVKVTAPEANDFLFRRVDSLRLSTRPRNCLKNMGVEWVYELVEKTEEEMLKTRGFGRKSLNEIKEVLASMGLSLGMTLPKVTPFHPPKG